MLQLILHLLGDYVFQNNWMANNKTKRNLPAIIHGLTYSLLFWVIYGYKVFLIVFITHTIIDRFRLVKYVLRLREGNFNNHWGMDTDNMPEYLWIWLMIIADNTIHLLINYLAIYYLS